MNEEYKYRVKVVFVDGSEVKFHTSSLHQTSANGSIVCWWEVSMNGSRLDQYSVSVRQIKDIEETDISQ